MPTLTVELLGQKWSTTYTDVPPTPPTSTINYLPKSFGTLTDYLAAGHGPKDARTADAKLADGKTPVYVYWPENAPADWGLEDQFRVMVAGQILVLKELGRDSFGIQLVYPIDSSLGFVAAGVTSYRDTFAKAMGQPESIPINGKWKGGKAARTWWAMARMRRGILGLGPKAIVEPTESDFTRFPQAPNSRYQAYYTMGGVEYKITGNQEKLIDHSANDTVNGVKVNGVNANPYIGNFTLRGRDFGDYSIAPEGDPAQDHVGVAYHGILANNMTVELMHFDSCWRGHGYSPNSETGAIGTGGTHTITDTTIDCLKAGRTSVIMSNSVGDGSTITNLDVLNPRGGVVRYESSGTHYWTNVRIPTGGNVNIEKNRKGYHLIWRGGTIGGKMNVRSPEGSSRLELINVENRSAIYAKITFSVWAATKDGKIIEPVTQLRADMTAVDANGVDLKPTIAGALAPA